MNIFDLFRRIERPTEPKQPITHLVVGLGNPGRTYEQTRHNAGFIALDEIAAKCGARVDRMKFRALVGEATVGGVRALLMKPQTFMNESGLAVREAADFYKIPPERILVLHDEISFAPGFLRIRRKGSAGGHNGLKSVIAQLGSEDFPRVKIGIGQKPSPDYDLADYVLGKLPPEDLAAVKDAAVRAAAAAELILAGKIDDAMMKYSK